MIKGHTTIELKDVKTGNVERFDDDNMITNALAHIFQNFGRNGGNLITNTDIKNDIAKTLLGGILALDTALTEQATNVTVPGGVGMTGNGCVDITSNDGVTEMGSYNSAESGWQNDGTLKMVWDFTTTQANGTIACVCLTSANGGYVGIGNATSHASKSTGRSLTAYADDDGDMPIDNEDYGQDRIVRTSFADSIITIADIDDYTNYFEVAKIKLHNHLVPLTKVDIRTTQTTSPKVSTTEVTTPSAFLDFIAASSNKSRQKVYSDDGCKYWIFGDSIYNTFKNNTDYALLKIDTSNVATMITVRQNTGDDLIVSNRNFAVSNNKLVFSDSSKTYFINLANLSDITSVNTALGSIIDACNGRVYGDYYVADTVLKTCEPINRNDYDDDLRGRSSDNPIVAYQSSYADSSNIHFRHVLNYIATINNLSSPVAKTADKTMKITYVLSFNANNGGE